jgi:iron(III) transport system ATP-binding protein
MASVELRRLTKTYASNNVVDAIDLRIEHGQMVCLLGPSGCGKTTTLRLLAGFMAPDGGEILVGDRRVSSPEASLPPERRNMSMIFQSYAVWPHMTVAENVAYGLTIRKLPKEEIKRRRDAILQVTRLQALAGRYPSELSGGQQQRVALARALVVEPEILLLDEPLSNLDANLREEMRFEIRRLHDQYLYTTVYVTHDQSEAMVTADRIVVMNQGRIEQVGSPEEIYERPESEFVARFIGGTNILKGRHLGDNLVECNGFRLHCGQGQAAPPSGQADTAVSVRLHEIELDEHRVADALNVASGKVVRQVYLGATRDYLVELPAGDQVRLTTDSRTNVPAGRDVWPHFPVDRCRALSR